MQHLKILTVLFIEKVKATQMSPLGVWTIGHKILPMIKKIQEVQWFKHFYDSFDWPDLFYVKHQEAFVWLDITKTPSEETWLTVFSNIKIIANKLEI